ncbi:ABC transporter ATP-binding protein [Planococcus halotolerans]|uniref:ABC transporter ATP-binding protein n=1 Tax=Planococcus halotolerans TaxID=2233542 RepID=A0A365L6D8_9BACL|nr:ABC transporter ATP-binding protein [Planococcus halotolerans]QHJ70300.1 ATP-binding cassette domain-containing protein [Planococcus halotolerans]RAZ80970.1 ABC transporter ATP-binding protein [Planococcus halotolerans]
MSLLEVKELTKSYNGTLAVDHVSFTLEERTATALIGPNGSGKTTTLSMIAGLLKESEGSIHRDFKSGIGFLPQYPQFFPWLSALEFTEMAAQISGVDGKKVRQQSIRTLEFVGLGSAVNKKTGTFSGGMRQRLGLAQAIVHQPKLLLLDEPVSALDPTGRREIMDLLKSLQQDATILYSTHILNDAEEMTDQLLFLKEGKLVEQGSLSEVKSRYAEPQIRLLFETEQAAVLFESRKLWPMQRDRNVIALPISYEGPSMQQVMAVLAKEESGIAGIDKQSASLEEIFLKVAGKK